MNYQLWRWGLFASSVALSAAAAGFNLEKKDDAQTAALFGGFTLALASTAFEHQINQRKKWLNLHEAAKEEIVAGQLAQAVESAIPSADSMMAMPLPALSPANTEAIVPLESILTQGVGIALFGNSGSGKSSIVQWLIGEAQPDSLVILDLHNDGKTWGQLPVLDSYEQILVKLSELLAELDRRREFRKQGKSMTPMMIICDEWPSIRAYAKKQKSDICDDFMLRLGCEARKYKMLSIVCSQSGNVKAMGLEGQGDFLENWCLVRLGKIAKKYAKNMPDRAIAANIQSQAYPCLINDELSIHPTHGHYQQFQDGQSPTSIKPYMTKTLLNQEQLNKNYDVLPTPRQWIEHLNQMYELPCERLEPNGTDGSASEEAIEPIERAKPLPEEERTHERTDTDPPEARVRGGSVEPEPNELHYYSQILKLHKTGMNKSQTIKQLWGVNRGGGSTYKNASEVYDNAQKHWESLSLW